MGTLPSLFEREHVEAAAAEHAIDPETLAATLAEHQSSVEDLPGIENIVYEWRKQFEDPLLARTASAYYLAVPAAVWDEFGAALDLDDDTLSAVIEVHRTTVTAACDVPATPGSTVEYIALDRTL